MNDKDVFSAVVEALAGDGFTSKLTANGVIFRGSITVAGLSVRLRLEFRDLEFCGPPYVFVENPGVLPRPVLPHLDEENELCVVDRRAFVGDRYHAAAEARGILVRAREVIERGLTRHAVGDIAEEFPQHWGGSSVGIEFRNYQGPTEFGSDAGGYKTLRQSRGRNRQTGWAVGTTARLSFDSNQGRPENLAEVLEWAAVWDRALPGKITEGLSRLSSLDPHILIVAPNGSVGFTLAVSSRGPAQVKALGRPEGWRRNVPGPLIRGLPIRRDHGYRADLAYALERSGDNVPPLAGRRVVLIGCGAIGGFLSRSLAQLGAGQLEGQLVLIDNESLAIGNIGRHVLGAGDAGRRKVEGCRSLILRDLPGSAVMARPFLVQTQRSLIGRGDLVIDATGEHAVSEMLNAWMLEAQADGVEFPSVLHVWIEGAGAAVQTFMGSDPKYGCLRCLKPDLASPQGRFSALRDEARVQLQGGCGQDLFTPYGAAAPMMAAALASQHAYDWAKGHPRPLLRTGRLDWENTKDVKPTNPSPSKFCPACGRAAMTGAS